MLDVCRFFSVRVSTISIFVGMHVVVVAELPSCWLVVISQLKSRLQTCPTTPKTSLDVDKISLKSHSTISYFVL